MINRYDIYDPRPGCHRIVRDDDGEYVRYVDVAYLLEEKTLEQHRKEFEVFCSNQGLNLKESSETGRGLFQSHVVGWVWKAWKAARGIE